MGAALVVGDGVDLVHNHRLHRAKIFAALLRRQQNVERLRRSDQNVRRPLQHRAPLRGQGIAGAHRGADRRAQIAPLQRQLLNLAQRLLQILLHIVAERLQRRDVDHLGRRPASEPSIALRISLSMQIKNAASVLPEPVGAEISVGLPARMGGQPCSCGSVGVPNLPTNHSCTTGCAQAKRNQDCDRLGGGTRPF